MSIIEQARKLYQTTTTAYSRGHIWSEQSQNYRDLTYAIGCIHTPDELIRYLDKKDMYNITITSQKKFDLMMAWNRKILGIDEDPYLITTPNLYKMYHYCDNILKHSFNINSIVELGGGNGQFARIAKRYIKYGVHIDIDIPESLYMAYVCTRHHFPEARCLWVTDEKSIDLTEWDFVFIPVGKEEILYGKNIDLFINTSSMGEMNNENIHRWMEFAQGKINVRYFFGCNRYLNTVRRDKSSELYQKRMQENRASLIFDRFWDIKVWEVEPLFTRCPWEDPRIARYLMILAVRNLEPVYPNILWLEAIKEQDWYCYRDADPLMTMRSNQLVHDLTMTGTLFKLWNALRFDSENRELNYMIATYLDWISKESTVFEEVPFYRRYEC